MVEIRHARNDELERLRAIEHGAWPALAAVGMPEIASDPVGATSDGPDARYGR